MTRDEYLTDTHKHAKRGMDLPHTKLPDGAIRSIREAVKKREELRIEAMKYSNKELAKKWRVSVRTIVSAAYYETGRHVL